MMHKIPFDYALFSGESYVDDFVAYVNLSDKQIKESSDFIADGHFTGELVDLPGKVYDKIMDAIVDDADKMARKNKIDGEISVIPLHLSPEFIKLLPEEVYKKIDMAPIFEERGVSSIEELLEKAEPEEVKEKSDAPFMKTLALRQPWASLVACGVKDIECRESMPTKCRKIFIAAMFMASVLGSAQNALPNDPAVKVGKLDNGMTYYIRHNDKPAQRAEFYLATHVGAIQETPDQDGLAHFLEHMCFNGRGVNPVHAQQHPCHP